MKIINKIIKWWHTSSCYFYHEQRIIFLYKKQVHREDGPAIIWDYGRYEYWYEGKQIPCNNTEEFKRKIKLLAFI